MLVFYRAQPVDHSHILAEDWYFSLVFIRACVFILDLILTGIFLGSRRRGLLLRKQ